MGDDSDEATHVGFRAARNDLYLAIGKVLDNDLDQTTFEGAEFIAAANPTAVLGLLDHLDAAEAKLARANRSLIELKPDPVLVEDSWIPAHELATVCGNFMRSSREFASQIKAAEAKLAAVREIHSSAWWYDEFCDDPSCEQEHVEIDVGDLYHAHPSWLVCECCSGGDLSDTNEPAPWPCPTIRALDEGTDHE